MKFSELISRIDEYIYSTKDYSTHIQFGSSGEDKKTIFGWVQLTKSGDGLIILSPISIPLNGVFKINYVTGDGDSLSNFVKFVNSHNAMEAEVKILDFPLIKNSMSSDNEFLVEGWCRNIEYIYFTEQCGFNLGRVVITHFITIA